MNWQICIMAFTLSRNFRPGTDYVGSVWRAHILAFIMAEALKETDLNTHYVRLARESDRNAMTGLGNARVVFLRPITIDLRLLQQKTQGSCEVQLLLLPQTRQRPPPGKKADPIITACHFLQAALKAECFWANLETDCIMVSFDIVRSQIGVFGPITTSLSSSYNEAMELPHFGAKSSFSQRATMNPGHEKEAANLYIRILFEPEQEGTLI